MFGQALNWTEPAETKGSELGTLAQTQSTPRRFGTEIVVSAEKGWQRDAGKVSRNRGESAVYIYTSYLVNWVDY